MEHRVVDAAVVAFQDVLHGREGVECLECPWSGTLAGSVATGATDGGGGAFTETGNIPDANSLIHGGRHDEVFLWVELGRHYVVRVAGEHCDAVARGAVPDPNRLVVGAGDL